MRVSLVLPPVTLLVLSEMSSLQSVSDLSALQFRLQRVTHDLSSWSWALRSSLDFFHRVAVFCSGCEYLFERCGGLGRG
jgi:hypothetical protein